MRSVILASFLLLLASSTHAALTGGVNSRNGVYAA